MESFHSEYSKLLGYTFYIRLSGGSETKIVMTPSPGLLYFQVCGKVFGINLIAPILSLENLVHQQEEQWVYIKIPATAPNDIELKFRREISTNIGRIYCRNCGKIVAEGFEHSYPMPSTNWETLSELWNCHPSHEPKYSLEMRAKSCYISLFYIHFKPDICNYIRNQENILFCGNCSREIGMFQEENVLYRHRVYADMHEDMDFLLEEALSERINESQREIHIGFLKVKLLKWNNFVYVKTEYKSCMNVMYQRTETEGFHLPQDDMDEIYKTLKKFNKKLPPSSRKFREWKVSLIVNR